MYSNTLTHQFTQDDAIAIYQNIHTTSGLDGINDVLSNDHFHGFFKEAKSNMVSGGRYRPLTLVIFALLWELVDNNPFWFHLLAVLSYAILGVLMLFVFNKVVPRKKSHTIWPVLAVILFMAHPIHTEVVANVKGMDETYSLLLSFLALLAAIKYSDTGKFHFLFAIPLFYVLALLSKENAVTAILFIPLIVGIYRKELYSKKMIVIAASLLIGFVAYISLRAQVVGLSGIGSEPSELMNNPFLKVNNGQYIPFSIEERWASIIYGLGKYVQLLFFPHPLTHDYYPRHFDVLNFKDLAVLMSLVMHITLWLIALLGLKKKSLLSLCIVFFYATIFLTSNIIFPIGTHISERFLFTPSLALTIPLALGFQQLITSHKTRKIGVFLFILGFGLYSIKTVSRNRVWQDDFTLFTTDVNVSSNSAKVRNAAGGALIDRAKNMEEGPERQQMFEAAINHLQLALQIHPNYKNAYLLLGNANVYLKNYPDAVLAYDRCLILDPNYDEASDNLHLALREGGRYAGSQLRNYDMAEEYLLRALEMQPKEYETVSLVGILYGNLGNHREALKYFESALKLRPDLARAYVNLGYAQLNVGLEDDARISFQEAVHIDPNALKNE